MRPRTVALLEDIQTAISYIHEDIAGMSYEAFTKDRRARQLVAHNLEIIGEAVSRLRREDSAVVERISGNNQIVGLRNALIHGYDVINYQIVWIVVQNSLPVLELEVNSLLQQDTP
jgi:uncharacterized protein with HEPN domain